jgi:hypothetical protein
VGAGFRSVLLRGSLIGGGGYTNMAPGVTSFEDPAVMLLSEQQLALGPGTIERIRIFVHENNLPNPVNFGISVTPAATSSTEPVDVFLATIGPRATDAVIVTGAPFPN